jgi:hypothetical protein
MFALEPRLNTFSRRCPRRYAWGNAERRWRRYPKRFLVQGVLGLLFCRGRASSRLSLASVVDSVNLSHHSTGSTSGAK